MSIVDSNHSIVGLDNIFYNTQTQTRALFFGGEERNKDLAQRFGDDAVAVTLVVEVESEQQVEGLDVQGRSRLAASIELLLDSGVRVMLATHRMENLLPAFSHVIGLKAGRVFCCGPRERILTRESLAQVYDLDRPTPGPRPREIPR